MPYLTKSRFKLATECETKLYYTKIENYADQSLDDDFLEALAEGGFQVGELAKFHFSDQPQRNRITVESAGYEEPLEDTRKRIGFGEPVIAEAAVRYQNLFIRVDIFQFDNQKKEINFYEVKAKSFSEEECFWNADRTKLNSKWKPYLYDVAFQKHVITKAYPKYKVHAHLILVDKDKVITAEGLNQCFTIDKSDGFTKIIYKDENLHRTDLGDDILTIQNTDREVDWIWKNFNKSKEKDYKDSLLFPDLSFEEYVHRLADAYGKDEKLETPLSKECKNCQYYTKPEDEVSGQRSGFKECWKEKAGLGDKDFDYALVTSFWGGKAGKISVVQKQIDKENWLLRNINHREYDDLLPTKDDHEMNPNQRRAIQIEKERNNDETTLLLNALKDEMKQWKYPLHFIDFETCAPALPFHKGQHPYEGIAFQYSHHKVYKDGTIEHTGQFLHTTRGVNPSIPFIRSLKDELENDSGTTFRYHNHENTFLLHIYFQLEQYTEEQVKDKRELQEFIRRITHLSDKRAGKVGIERWEGKRNMVDMHEMILKYHYSPFTQGSNSIKAVLPAVIHDSQYIRNKYSQPIYGKNHEIPSLNFEEHIWIREEYGMDPYKTLPPVFEGYDDSQLDSLVQDLGEIHHGGAAMVAYSRLQFSNVPEDQREQIRQALLKYCELDTMAMVMIREYWQHELWSSIKLC